ncbi:MAG: putative porin [Bacteroidota bacterium]
MKLIFTISFIFELVFIIPITGNSLWSQVLSDSNRFAIPSSATFSKPVTSKADTTTNKKDSTVYSVPLRRHGSMYLLKPSSYSEITKEEIQHYNYKSFSDLIYNYLPAYPLSVGAYGGFNHFSLFGGHPNDVAVNFNGRPLNDLEFGSLNIEQWSPEFMEKAEILVGSDAVIFSDNSSGCSINIQEIRYNTSKPYTRLWYSQGEYDLISFDGIFSQNIFPNWNFTFGFGTMNATGRFPDSWVSHWNVRGILRWNPSDKTSISLTENFTNQGIGTNGGSDIKKSTSIYDNIDAVQFLPDVNERVFRHDLNLTLTSYLFDSTALTGTLFFSHSAWEQDLSTDLYNTGDSSFFKKHNSNYFGLNARYEQNIFKFFNLRIGGSLLYANAEKSDYIDSISTVSLSVFGHGQMYLSSFLELSGGIRLRYINDRKAVSIGGKSTFSFSDIFKISGDISLSERVPNPSEGLSLKNELHLLMLAETELTISKTLFKAGVFFRNVSNPISYDSISVFAKARNFDTKQIFGAHFRFETNLFDKFDFSTNFQIYYSRTDGSDDKRFPNFYTNFRLSYLYKIGLSELRVGLNTGFMTSKKGEWFNPLTRAYLPVNEESGFQYQGISAFAEVRFRTAFVKVSFDNLLSQGYYYVPFYPEFDRNLKISVAWPFGD